MSLKKLISMILVVHLLSLGIPIQSFASEQGLLFSEPIAKKLYIDMQYCNQSLESEKSKTEILQTNNNLLEEKDKANLEKIKLLQDDNDILQKESNSYKGLYDKAKNEKIDISIGGKVAKMKWWLIGAISMIPLFFIVK